MRVLITDGHVPAALCTVRSLGRHGFEPNIAVARGMFPLAGTSRHCRGLVHFPEPASAPDDYAEAVLREVRRGYDAVLPLSDLTHTACAPARREIERYAAYCTSPESAIVESSDKWSLLEIAREAGFAVPEARLVESPAAWRKAAEALPPPTVHRARRSIFRTSAGLVKPRVSVVFDREAATLDAEQRLSRGEPFVVTSYFPGTGRGIYLFMVGGRAVLWFGHLRLRETNPAGSASCAARPLVPSPVELDRAEQVMRRLGIEGAAMLELRRDRDSGEDRIVELNPRLWGSVSLAKAEGLDFPFHQIEYFSKGTIPIMPDRLAEGPGVRYLSAEISRLLHTWQGPPAGWQADYPSIGSAWREFVRGFRDGMGYYVHDRDDPLPSFTDPINYLATLIGGARRQRVARRRRG